MTDLMSDAFEGMWGDMKKKPLIKKAPKASSQGSVFVNNVQPVNYRPQVQRGLTQAQQYALIKKRRAASARTNKLIRKAAKGILKTGTRAGRAGAAAAKRTETYQKLSVKRQKSKIWKQYKIDKQKEARDSELKSYKEKLYGKPKKKK